MTRTKPAIAALCLLLVVAGCASPTVSVPTLVPTWTPRPSPTLTPTPTATPTPTPVPALDLTLLWPETVSALEPAPIEVVLEPLTGASAPAAVRADVFDPFGERFATFDLAARAAYRYSANDALQLPLYPVSGTWQLVVDVTTDIEVRGEPVLEFEPEPLAFHDLGGVLPEGVALSVPEACEETDAQGDAWAGSRTWLVGRDTLSLWWAPGPTELLLLNTAVVMLEATQLSDRYERLPEIVSVEETTWGEQIAFRFIEHWPGRTQRHAEAWVIQGPDDWLYVLRLRPRSGDDIPPLLGMIAETFVLTGK